MSSAPAVRALERAIASALELLEADDNSVRRARVALALADYCRDAASQFADQRTAALMALRDEGWSLGDLKGEFGIARQRLSQLINREEYKAARQGRHRT